MAVKIGEIIKFYRQKTGFSQEELADQICSRKYIGDIEADKCTPTLDIVNLLSKKLGTDLYATFSDIFRYGDIQTYFDSKELRATIFKHDVPILEKCIQKYENDPRFAKGEALQELCYANAVLKGQKYDYQGAAEWALRGLKERHPGFPDKDKTAFSNSDYSLLLSLGVSKGRLGQMEEAGVIFDMLMTDALSHLSLKYEAESNKAFYLNLLCSATSNKYYYCDADSENMLDQIDQVINYQKTNNRSHMLCELLLCKAALLSNAGREKDAKEAYRQAKVFGSFYYDKERYNILEDCLYKEKLK